MMTICRRARAQRGTDNNSKTCVSLFCFFRTHPPDGRGWLAPVELAFLRSKEQIFG